MAPMKTMKAMKAMKSTSKVMTKGALKCFEYKVEAAFQTVLLWFVSAILCGLVVLS